MLSTKREIKVHNPHLKQENDMLFHLGFKTNTTEFFETFSGVKFVCMGGSAHRMLLAAQMCVQVLKDVPGLDLPSVELKNLCTTDRYVCYKVGPVLFINHGIGISSLVVVLHEIIKALYYAKSPIVSLIRIGTSGGIGVRPGTIVLTNEALNGVFGPLFEMPILGEVVRKVCKFDDDVNKELKASKLPADEFDVVVGKTMSALDFYEGQGRLDGSYCDYTAQDKLKYLKKLKEAGVVNIEMEAQCIGALAHQANIRAAVVCVTLVDRLQDDLVTSTCLDEWEKRPIQLVLRMIKRHLETSSS